MPQYLKYLTKNDGFKMGKTIKRQHYHRSMDYENCQLNGKELSLVNTYYDVAREKVKPATSQLNTQELQ